MSRSPRATESIDDPSCKGASSDARPLHERSAQEPKARVLHLDQCILERLTQLEESLAAIHAQVAVIEEELERLLGQFSGSPVMPRMRDDRARSTSQTR